MVDNQVTLWLEEYNELRDGCMKWKESQNQTFNPVLLSNSHLIKEINDLREKYEDSKIEIERLEAENIAVRNMPIYQPVPFNPYYPVYPPYPVWSGGTTCGIDKSNSSDTTTANLYHKTHPDTDGCGQHGK